MLEAKGCPTRQRQGQRITVTTETMTLGIVSIIIGIIVIRTTITVGISIEKKSNRININNTHNRSPLLCNNDPPGMQVAYLVAKIATDRQADIYRPIRCSSLTLEREEYLIVI
jgi:hypothetical protein